MRTWLGACCFGLALIALTACQGVPGIPSAPTPARQITYDGPLTLSIKAGETFPGTNIAYVGKAPDGRAILKIDGLQALKSTADSVEWRGALVIFSLIDMQLRVLTYDDKGITLAGTVHVIVQDPQPAGADLAQNPMAKFTFPVTFTVNRNENIPGTVVSYTGAQSQGAEFSNLDQFPYRQRFDSVVWQGRLRDRIGVKMDLRVLNFDDNSAVLGGTTTIVFEPQ